MKMISVNSSLSLEDILAAVNQEPDLTGFKTHAEWAEHFEVTHFRMDKLLHQAQRAGVLERTRTRRESIDGAMRWSPVYRFHITQEAQEEAQHEGE